MARKKKQQQVSLMSLEGEHELSGVCYYRNDSEHDIFELYEALSFVLDGITYVAVADAGDGYRSLLDHLEVRPSEECGNRFPPQKVNCIYCNCLTEPDFNDPEDWKWEYMDENSEEFALVDQSKCLVMEDAITKKAVLIIGTEHTDDYYPYCVTRFMPENMAINEGKMEGN